LEIHHEKTFNPIVCSHPVRNRLASGGPASQVFHCSGSGVFAPANIGNARGGTFGLVLGDGSGISEYMADGGDFTINGQVVGSGFNAHQGGNVSRTSGIVSKNGQQVTWPARSNQLHVITSDEGQIFMKYSDASYTLDLTTGVFGGEGNFQIVGGTGRFEKARGMVWVEVVVTGPPGAAIPFNYDFNGSIVLGR
jgi:hypothetical protein